MLSYVTQMLFDVKFSGPANDSSYELRIVRSQDLMPHPSEKKNASVNSGVYRSVKAVIPVAQPTSALSRMSISTSHIIRVVTRMVVAALFSYTRNRFTTSCGLSFHELNKSSSVKFIVLGGRVGGWVKPGNQIHEKKGKISLCHGEHVRFRLSSKVMDHERVVVCDSLVALSTITAEEVSFPLFVSCLSCETLLEQPVAKVVVARSE
ncbi:unnamed protein product [Phytophthora fragariaefolia]|uniref:Unnamed protein product n=1 Tax=Phytophthora fragariaefolia TaxID=1490495 RepID=A0A9W6X826_9STRA|nr:unnamed protein product [Phytophthora fragariaefolia]